MSKNNTVEGLDEPECWSFVIDKIESRAVGGRVWGWFMYFKVHKIRNEDGGYDEELSFYYLTPFKEPTAIEVPRFFIHESDNSGLADLEIGPKQIYNGLLKLFRVNYDEVPSPPATEIPLHRIPPSKRESIQQSLEQWGY